MKRDYGEPEIHIKGSSLDVVDTSKKIRMSYALSGYNYIGHPYRKQYNFLGDCGRKCTLLFKGKMFGEWSEKFHKGYWLYMDIEDIFLERESIPSPEFSAKNAGDVALFGICLFLRC